MDKAIVFLSLMATPITILSALLVVWLWFVPAKNIVLDQEKENIDWFILGVFIHFFGSVIDNGYWGIAWTLDYLEHDYRDTVFNHGVYSNLPFRQIATTLAACCHIKAAAGSNHTIFKWLFGMGAVVTSIYMVLLVAQ